MTATRHLPLIADGRASCSCRQWTGTQRSDDETNGEFTTRAYLAHRKHAEAPEPPPPVRGAHQAHMFDTQEMF